jgi:hypothetical protein
MTPFFLCMCHHGGSSLLSWELYYSESSLWEDSHATSQLEFLYGSFPTSKDQNVTELLWWRDKRNCFIQKSIDDFFLSILCRRFSPPDPAGTARRSLGNIRKISDQNTASMFQRFPVFSCRNRPLLLGLGRHTRLSSSSSSATFITI